ncbi:MAG: hypothetical protein LC104_11820 [Bacteroidales bacterium]|nr:hypothetical protein [Bacteroidales bacterium]
MPRFLAILSATFLSPLLVWADFRAGAAAVDVTPEQFPVIVNGSFLEKTATKANDPLHARALVLDDGATRLALVVVDSCMMPREFLDQTKALIQNETRIPTERMLISATHTHTAPAAMGCLGSDADPKYGEYLQRQIVRAVRQAIANLAPAQAGHTVTDAGAFTNCRRWIFRSDKVKTDPFGFPTMRAHMHPGYQNPDVVGPSGPVDPGLSLLAIRTVDDKPLAVLANFSMHYFGSAPVSADYYGAFCAKLSERVGGQNPQFVSIMSQGTSGDLHWMDYAKPRLNLGMVEYAHRVAAVAEAALQKVQYRRDITLAMAETRVTFGRRTPNAERLAWAKAIAAKAGPKPKNQQEIYAREAILLDAEPTRELKLQAIRIGDLGIAAIPNEVYGLTGLKIKSRSPLTATFNIELANGADGYIPPPEQHVLGGYTTWPARTAGLEPTSETRIVETLLGLLEKVSGRKRRADIDPASDAYAQAVLATKPIGYWRLGDLEGTVAHNCVGDAHGQYEPGVVFGLEGLPTHWVAGRIANRAAQFAGGRMVAKLPPLGDRYTIAFRYWPGLPASAPAATAPILTLVSGQQTGTAIAISADEDVPQRTWAQVVLVRDGAKTQVYRNGKLWKTDTVSGPKLAGETTLFVGGTANKTGRFEGRIAEVAVYDRAFPPKEAATRSLMAAETR